jgi:hypothetical protein
MSELAGTRELIAEQQRALRVPSTDRARPGSSFAMSAAMADSKSFEQSESNTPKAVRSVPRAPVNLATPIDLAQGSLAGLVMAQTSVDISTSALQARTLPQDTLAQVVETIVVELADGAHEANTEIELGELGTLKIRVQLTAEGEIMTEFDSDSTALANGLVRSESVLRQQLANEGLVLARFAVSLTRTDLGGRSAETDGNQDESESEVSMLRLIRRASSVL